MPSVHFISNNIFYRPILEYVYELGKDDIQDFFYVDELNIRTYHYRNKSALQEKEKVLMPGELEIQVSFEGDIIHCKHEIMRDHNNNIEKLMQASECCGGPKGQIIFAKITLSSNTNKEILVKFVDKAREIIREKLKKTKIKSIDEIRVYYYKDYWYLFSKIPKRPIDTLYLKENELKHIVKSITEFFSPETRKDYISYGIPYKNVTFLYGVPGSGKTSTINTIASYFSCDIFMLPLSSDMDDSSLVDAFSNVENECRDSERENERKIIVIEDIDCIFNERKKGDSHKNGITLQGLLNCMDGFTCIEGALLFITANKAETLDEAVIRSCRVDYKLELSNADEFQTKCMFDRFLPHQPYNYKKFYNAISHKKYTTAMLQEFFFFNRKCLNILDKISELHTIIDKNNPDMLSSEDKDNMNAHYT